MKYIYEQQKTYLIDFINSLSLERNLSEKTLYAYKSDLVCLLTWLNENRYDLLNTQSISDYFLYLQKDKKLSPRSIRRKYVSIKQFFYYINTEKGINEIFMKFSSRKFQLPKSLPRTLSITEINQLISTVSKEYWSAPSDFYRRLCLRDMCIIEVLFCLGLRIGEVAALNIGDYDSVEASFLIHGKGNKERLLFISSIAVNQKLQKFNAKINTVTIGSGDKTVTIGGDSTYPFYSFDAPSENAPKIGVEISDMGLENIVSEGIKAYYDGASTIGEMAKKAAAMEGADFVALILEGGDPNGVNKSVDELIAVVKEVADAIDAPLVVEGCKNVEKDAELLPKVAEALQGRNVLILSEKEENYKAIGAAAGLAYDQIVGAESAVDINLAKQLNVVTTQLGVNAQKIVMNIGSAAAGYGYEYVVSTMDRIKGAALSQNDNMLQMPIITPVSAETWGVKEATASEKDMPEWGPEEERGIDMEVMTAAADLAAGSDAVILRHPEAVAAISRMIKALA